MRVDSNTYENMNNAESLLERIKILLASGEYPEVVYNVVSDQVRKIEDIALIQCFYGTDIQRIRATT